MKKFLTKKKTDATKKHTCTVCGREFKLTKDKHYISAIKKEFLGVPEFHDSFDCPYCGCQYTVESVRQHKWEPRENKTEE